MKLDASGLRFLTRDDFRVLTAVEMGMKNHDIVPAELIAQIASLRHGGVSKLLSNLLRHKLLHHDSRYFDGYRLTPLGYDYLALHAMVLRGKLSGVGRQIGVGKESDVFVVNNDDGVELCLKVHRLGRTSFRAIKNKRDYHKGRKSPSWLYLSRLAAKKEFEFMTVLKQHGFPVPEPVDCNRHCVLMSLVDHGFPLNQVRTLENKEAIYIGMMDLIIKFGHHGLIHGDFNEFNVMIDQTGKLTVIDFPQMVSTSHPNAKMYFERDVNCVRRFFRKRFEFTMDYKPEFEEVVSGQITHLDRVVSASGFTQAMSKELDSFVLDNEDEQQETQGETMQDNSDEDAKALTTDGMNTGSGDKDNRGDPDEDKYDDLDGSTAYEQETIGDGPDAYLAHDYITTTKSLTAPRVDDIRQRVRREQNKKQVQQKGKRAAKTSRNVVKNRERRAALQMANEF